MLCMLQHADTRLCTHAAQERVGGARLWGRDRARDDHGAGALLPSFLAGGSCLCMCVQSVLTGSLHAVAHQREFYDLESFYGAAEEVQLPFTREEQQGLGPSWTRQF